MLRQAQDFPDLVLMECPYYDCSQIKGDCLQVDILRRMPCFHVHISYSPLTIPLGGAFVDGGEDDVDGTILDTALPQRGSS